MAATNSLIYAHPAGTLTFTVPGGSALAWLHLLEQPRRRDARRWAVLGVKGVGRIRKGSREQGFLVQGLLKGSTELILKTQRAALRAAADGRSGTLTLDFYDTGQETVSEVELEELNFGPRQGDAAHGYIQEYSFVFVSYEEG
jgi:hypothetical protein